MSNLISQLPPGPKSWPIIGNYRGENKLMVFHKMFYEYRKKYGSLITMFWGDTPIIFVNDLEIAMNLFGQENGRKVAGRKNSYLDIIVSGNKNNLFQLNYGAKWREMIKITKDSILKTLFQERIEIDIHKSIDKFCEELMKNFDNENTGVFPFDECYWLSDNVVLSVYIGRTFDLNDHEYQTLYETRRDVFDVLDNADFANWVPYAHHLPIPSVLKVKQQNKKLDDLLFSFLDKVKKTNNYKKEPKTVAEHFWKVIEEGNLSESEVEINDTNVCFVFKDILFASYEGIGLTNVWFLGLLATHPDIQQKIRDQVQQLSAQLKDPIPKFNWRDQLPYVVATCNEFFRWASLVGILDFHYSLAPVTIDNPSPDKSSKKTYTIPPDCYIGINQYALNHDPNVFPNPDKINPENFLDKNGKYIERREFWGFGYGVRMCPGVPVTKGYSFLLLCNLCMRYKFEWTQENKTDHLVDDPINSGLFRYPLPFYIKITKI